MKKTKKIHKNKKGGFLFKNSKVSNLSDCDPLKLTNIKGSKELHEKYHKCCPKGFFGSKNTSPYCKQIDLNFQAAREMENLSNEFHGYNYHEIDKLNEIDNKLQTTKKKYWYFFGGKTKYKKNTNTKKCKTKHCKNFIPLKI